jgi:alpha-beta hydrolase superfamily lysophospholipase
LVQSQHRELTIPGSDGTPLDVVDWPLARGQAGRGGVVLMHGLGEHCRRYAHVARFFNDCGWAVRSYDHRGHGRSGGARGDVSDNEAILRDAKLVLDDFSRQFETPPLLLGDSMGGLFAARFATGALSPLRGLILVSPALSVHLSRAQKLLLKVLNTIAPGFGVPNGLPTRYLSHDRAVAVAYKKDPLVHSRISARLVLSMLAAINHVRSHASILTIPTLLLVAGDDRLVDPAGSKAFHAALAPGIGTMHWYPDFYHEIFNETDAQRVFDDLRHWLTSKV